MLQIKNSPSPYSEQKVNISGKLLTLVFKYIGRGSLEGDWYLDIKNSSNTVDIISGLMIKPNQNITGRYILEEFPSGNFWCFRNVNTKSKIKFDNLGEGKDYSVFWISSEEEQELGFNGSIQL